MSQDNAQTLIKELMEKYGHGNAWDEQEFNRMFDLFQEDGEEDEDNDSQAGGLDVNEFTKLVSRMAQLWLLHLLLAYQHIYISQDKIFWDDLYLST